MGLKEQCEELIEENKMLNAELRHWRTRCEELLSSIENINDKSKKTEV